MVNENEYERLIGTLRVHGFRIGSAAERGDESAQKVMEAYEFWRRCPGDGMGFVLCEDALNDWLDANPAPKAEGR